jgi:orotate phosphoribosyltransferase
MISSDLKNKLKSVGIFKEGVFDLKSGDISNHYFDIRKAYGNPELINQIVDSFSKKIKEEGIEYSSIACSGYGGIPLGVALSLKENKKLSLVRESVKQHGTQNQIEGYIPVESDKVLIVDDVYSSGTSIRKTMEGLSSVNIVSGIVFLDRQEKEKSFSFPIYSIVNSTELLS